MNEFKQKLELTLNRLYKENKLSIDTYAELMEFADPNQNLQLQQTCVMARCNINLVGRELNYISPITKAKQPFKVSDVFVNIFTQGLRERQVYAEVFAVSEKGNKYKIDEFSEVQV